MAPTTSSASAIWKSGGASRYEAFDIYYPMFFPLKDKAFTIEARPPQGDKSALRVTALTYEQRLAPYKAQIEVLRGDQPIWELRFPDERTAYLKMPTWAVFNSKWGLECVPRPIF